MFPVVPLDPGNITIVNVRAKDTSAAVSWKVTSQEACSGIAVNYTLFYRPHNEGQLSEATTDD